MKTQNINFLRIYAGIFVFILVFAACPEPDNPNEHTNLVSEISLNESQLTLTVGETATLIATVLPVEAVNRGFSWSSSNTDIAVINNGIVTAVSPGTAVIIVSVQDSEITAQCVVSVHLPVFNSRDRFEAMLNDDTGKIRDSFSYENYDFYYIYLGRMSNIPIFSPEIASITFDGGVARSFYFTTERIATISIENIISNSIADTIGVLESNTVAIDEGGSRGWEAGGGAKFSIFGFIEIGGEGKTNGEKNWNNHRSRTIDDSFETTRSVENTIAHATSHTESSIIGQGFELFPGNRPGRYRLTLFSISDVYLYIIRDTVNDVFYYEFREHVVPGYDKYEWVVEYAEHGQPFNTSGNNFKIEISWLENLIDRLTKVRFCTVTFDVNNTDNGSTGVYPQSISVISSEAIDTLPNPPLRPGWTFIGWNKNADGSGSAVNEFTIITDSITVYAQWVEMPPVPPLTLTVDRNPITSGTVNPPFQSNITPGVEIPISATPSSVKYRFINWTVISGTATFGNANSLNTTVILNSDTTIRANFKENPVVIRDFTTPGSHSYIFNEGFPATIEVYALGAGGGGQGGHRANRNGSPNYCGTGGAGGGGTAAYMKFDVAGLVSFTINIGEGGNGGDPVFRGAGVDWRSGLTGVDGGSTSVIWTGGNSLTVAGGKGGGEGRINNESFITTIQQQIIAGGSGGVISIKPSVITSADWRAASGNEGENGVRGDNGNWFSPSRGGNSGAVNFGSFGFFGSRAVGFNYDYSAVSYTNFNFTRSLPDFGAGGAGGFSEVVNSLGNNADPNLINLTKGGKGGNGRVIIYVTYWD